MVKKHLFARAHSDATGGAAEREVENFLEETAMMKKVSSGECCHVVQMVGCVSTALPLALALEFVPYGNLLSYLKYWRKKVHTIRHKNVAITDDTHICNLLIHNVHTHLHLHVFLFTV